MERFDQDNTDFSKASNCQVRSRSRQKHLNEWSASLASWIIRPSTQLSPHIISLYPIHIHLFNVSPVNRVTSNFGQRASYLILSSIIFNSATRDFLKSQHSSEVHLSPVQSYYSYIHSNVTQTGSIYSIFRIFHVSKAASATGGTSNNSRPW